MSTVEEWLTDPDNVARLREHYGDDTDDLIKWAKVSDCKSDPLGCPRCAVIAFASGTPFRDKRFQRSKC